MKLRLVNAPLRPKHVGEGLGMRLGVGPFEGSKANKPSFVPRLPLPPQNTHTHTHTHTHTTRIIMP